MGSFFHATVQEIPHDRGPGTKGQSAGLLIEFE